MASRSTGIFVGKTWSRRPEGLPPSPQTRWNSNNREKLQAHEAVRKALLNGTLKRGKCEVCQSLRCEAHHTDYGKPLSVTWLCRKHHRALHAELRKALKDADVRKGELLGREAV